MCGIESLTLEGATEGVSSLRALWNDGLACLSYGSVQTLASYPRGFYIIVDGIRDLGGEACGLAELDTSMARRPRHRRKSCLSRRTSARIAEEADPLADPSRPVPNLACADRFEAYYRAQLGLEGYEWTQFISTLHAGARARASTRSGGMERHDGVARWHDPHPIVVTFFITVHLAWLSTALRTAHPSRALSYIPVRTLVCVRAERVCARACER